MLRASRENLHSIYVLLFLNVAFFFLEIQDLEKYQALFAFDRQAVLGGEIWRLFTYQFVQGRFLGSPALSLFFSLMILYVMGTAVEEELGTAHFVVFFLLSTLGSAALAFLFGVTLLSSLFLSYSLLFAFARLYPDQTFYLLILPVKVRWLAYLALAFLVLGMASMSFSSFAAAFGAGLSFLYFWWVTGARMPRRKRPPLPVERVEVATADSVVQKNLARFARMKETLSRGDAEEIAALEKSISADIVRGVNICPPADYKPEHEDRYCARCEGFAECSVRYLKINATTSGTVSIPSVTAQ